MMKKLFLLPAAILVLLAACSPRAEQLQTGDLIFVGIPADYSLDKSSMDSAIAQATGSETGLNLIHTAIAEVDPEGRVWIIDATIKHGVDRHPLDTFLRDFTLRDGSYPVFKILRLKDNRQAAQYVDNAKKQLGLPYDSAFMPDNDALYCTELVYECYRDGNGQPLFHAAPMNFKNAEGEFPLYWEQLFALLDQPIPQGIPGTNPQGMAEESVLRPVAVELIGR